MLDPYLESRILAADSTELIEILYEKAVEAVRNARGHLARGWVAQRSACISRALDLLGVLAASLDRDAGGEMVGNLARLYDYLERRLIEANLRQSDPPLAEAEELLDTLWEGWSEMRRRAAHAKEGPGEAFCAGRAWCG